MANSFSTIPVAVNERSRQNLSHPAFFTADFGRMDVVYCNSDIIAGDDVNLKIDGFLRGAPMPAPTEGKIDIDIRVFFVPHRILCSRENEPASDTKFSWDDFITGLSSNAHPYFLGSQFINRVINQSGDPLKPSASFIGDIYKDDLRRLYGELGLPAAYYNTPKGVFANSQRINPFRFYAYQRVWWDWYRDSSLIEESLIRDYIPLCTSGQISDEDSYKILFPRYCCYKKDFYNTAKLNPQSGTASAVAGGSYSMSNGKFVWVGNPAPSSTFSTGLSVDNTPQITGTLGGSLPVQWLRAANALQKYLERNNLSGSRLMERFLARFGNAPSSVALDMSEYLGGASRSLQIGDITSNNEQNGIDESAVTNAFGTPTNSRGTIQGQLGGKCMSDVSSGEINFHAKEFGTIIAIQTIRPNMFYYEGLTRDLTRGTDNDKFAYFTPEMENLGYQPIYQKELFVDETTSAGIFGYVPRYSDYKYAKGVVAGDFILDETSAGMNAWYLSHELYSMGELNKVLSPAFTTISPFHRSVMDRIFSINNGTKYDHFNVFANCEVHMSRPMSASSLPSLDEDLGQHGNVVSVPNGGVRM